MNRGYAYRRYKRHVKATRRLTEDRAQHGNPQNGEHARRITCECFEPDGRIFARFADYPAVCSCAGCGNARHLSGPTRQERRAPTAADWS